MVVAHGASRGNHGRLRGRCGCFHCLSTFTAEQVILWIEDGRTALCPVCGMDAVVDETVLPITEAALRQMYRRWFKHSPRRVGTGW